MKDQTTKSPGYYLADQCDLGTFADLTAQSTASVDVPHASQVVQNVPIYDTAQLADQIANADTRRVLMAEWATILHSGAGAFVLKQAQADHQAIDQATAAYERIIADEKSAGGDGADHFAAAGNNDRVWNSLQKLCEADADLFMRYHASPAIDAASEAWLGPNYQMTAQLNVVRPGGQAQRAHRDYHLGFQTADVSATYPAHVHDLSPLMTLQGGLAHCDMPVESGTTKLLPFSQAYRPGYAAWRREDFRAHFEDHYVQLPLDKGDAIFFSPAIFHGAGDNRSTDVNRMVNLFQISSAFGRAMENIDRAGMCRLLLPHLRSASVNNRLTQAAIDAVIASAAEGYSFPTNLDNDPPVGGLAPETQAALLRRAIQTDMSPADFAENLEQMERRKQA